MARGRDNPVTQQELLAFVEEHGPTVGHDVRDHFRLKWYSQARELLNRAYLGKLLNRTKSPRHQLMTPASAFVYRLSPRGAARLAWWRWRKEHGLEQLVPWRRHANYLAQGLREVLDDEGEHALGSDCNPLARGLLEGLLELHERRESDYEALYEAQREIEHGDGDDR